MTLDSKKAPQLNPEEQRMGLGEHACIDPEDLPAHELPHVVSSLLTILGSNTVLEILHGILTTMNGTVRIHGCAFYCACTGAGLHRAYGIGNHEQYLPSLISHGSDLHQAITERRSAATGATQDIQPSLFDDPVSHFCPIHVNGVLDSVVVVIHDACDTRSLDVVLSGAASIIRMSCRVDSEFKCATCTQIGTHCARRESCGQTGAMRTASDLSDNGLTCREREILPLLAKGLSNKEIADRLFISPDTSKHHVTNIFAKLKVHTRAAAVSAWLTMLDNDDHSEQPTHVL
jgi:DNA-binding CsgD family transcriptional regulator